MTLQNYLPCVKFYLYYVWENMAGRRLTNTILTGVVAVIVIAAVVIVPFEVLGSTHPFHQTTTQPPPSSTHLGMLNSTQVGNVKGAKKL